MAGSWQDRVIAERCELEKKISALNAFVRGQLPGGISPEMRELMVAQEAAMRRYSSLLQQRLELAAAEAAAAAAAGLPPWGEESYVAAAVAVVALSTHHLDFGKLPAGSRMMLLLPDMAPISVPVAFLVSPRGGTRQGAIDDVAEEIAVSLKVAQHTVESNAAVRQGLVAVAGPVGVLPIHVFSKRPGETTAPHKVERKEK